MEVFPKVLQQQELGWNMNDTYQTISVELMFHSWKRAEHYLSTLFNNTIFNNNEVIILWLYQ